MYLNGKKQRYAVFYGEFENENKKGQTNLTFWLQGFAPQIFSNFPAHDLNFHLKRGAQYQIKQVSKRDRTLYGCKKTYYFPSKWRMYLKLQFLA